jgi:hypothetical protein
MKYLSVFNSDEEILKALSDIHLKGKWYDLDCTFSKGVFYKNIKEPEFKSDLEPVVIDVKKADSQNLWFLKDNQIDSLVFDPPFLFRNRKSINDDKICKRFSYFKTFDELVLMYENSLKEFLRVLKPRGYVFFKCQDMTDGKFYCSHNKIINIAEEIGFELKDIAIKYNKNKLQADAKQQNCVGKVHSYWLVFKKTPSVQKASEGEE